MAEYKSFHYLMHATPESGGPVHYAEAPKPLTFDQLYSPRDQRQIHKSEKSYWRTRDRIEFTIYEDRSQKVVFVTCRNLESNDVLRTIFLSMEHLYFELDCKARGNRDPLTKKTDKALNDTELMKSIGDFILARINIKKEAVEWPTFVPALPRESDPTSAACPAKVQLERMCTFDKLSSDVYETLEISYPPGLSLEGVAHVKVAPTIAEQVDGDPAPDEQSLQASGSSEVSHTTVAAPFTAVLPVAATPVEDSAAASPGTTSNTKRDGGAKPQKPHVVAPAPAASVNGAAQPSGNTKKRTSVIGKGKKIAPEV